ncbi:hypothetical protein [Streptomyces sp. NPDC004629]|uniref:hypothetical protein n=1 Tax=Streptomyces sp. NPDC004629 TaxID=3364705 RepID=UPI003694730E
MQTVASWLLISAVESADRAWNDWATGGIALLRCGGLFAAVRMSAGVVHAAAGSDEPEPVCGFLDEALHGGPVFTDQLSSRYYALVPPSTAQRPEWTDGRHGGAECLGVGSYLGVPSPTLDEEHGHRSYWCVPMRGPGNLCTADAVSQLVLCGRYRLAIGAAS